MDPLSSAHWLHGRERRTPAGEQQTDREREREKERGEKYKTS